MTERARRNIQKYQDWCSPSQLTVRIYFKNRFLGLSLRNSNIQILRWGNFKLPQVALMISQGGNQEPNLAVLHPDCMRTLEEQPSSV